MTSSSKHLKDEQTLSILNQTNKPIEIYNQLRILVQENNFLHLNLKQKNQETNQIIQVSNKKISLDGTKKRSEIKALDERLKEMRYQESELNRAMEAKKEELKNMEEKYLDVYNDLKNQENFGNGLYNNTVNMRHTVSGHRHNKQQKEEKLDVLTEQNARLKFELKNLKAELERLNTNNKDVNLSTKIINENKMLKKELNALPECKREIERLNKELEKVDKINRGLGDYVSTLNVNELQSQNKSKDFEIKNLKEINDRMYKELLKYNKNIRKNSFL